VELKVTFKEGGAFDFHTHFERIKDRLQQAVEHARDRGSAAAQSSAGGGINFTNVHLDELPAYDGPNNTDTRGPSNNETPQPPARETPVSNSPAPMEPPPGYEEVQSRSVAEELEEQLRRAR
jgi:WW domain-binding protein 2